MMRLVCCLLALAMALVISLGVQPTAVAQPAPTPVQPRVTCPVAATVTTAFPATVLGDCSLTHGSAAKPTPLDEYTVRTQHADGTRYEVVVTRAGKVLRTTKILPHSDRIESQGTGIALLFWAFALATVGGALFVVTRRNLIAAVMGMVGSFLGISAVYMMLFANFLAVVQMLVYAGAIMVLFIFVIMVLNRPEDEPVAPTGRAGLVVGGLASIYLIGRLIMLLIDVRVPDSVHDVAREAPRLTAEGHDWGSVKAVGTDLFSSTSGLFPFEAISILLLVAVVGAIAIARPLSRDDGQDAGQDPGQDPGTTGAEESP